MYLNASVHCLFCHPHSNRSLDNRGERQMASHRTLTVIRLQHQYERGIGLNRDKTYLKINSTFPREDQFKTGAFCQIQKEFPRRCHCDVISVTSHTKHKLQTEEGNSERCVCSLMRDEAESNYGKCRSKRFHNQSLSESESCQLTAEASFKLLEVLTASHENTNAKKSSTIQPVLASFQCKPPSVIQSTPTQACVG